MSRADKVLWLGTLLLCVVLLWWAIALAVGGWVPQGDNAVIAAKVHDVFSWPPPLQGQRSTSSLSTQQVYAHHPGPIEFYLLAIPYLISGFAPAGLLVGNALVQIGFVVAAIRVARVTGGLVGGWLAAGVVAVLLAGFGDLLIRPLNLYFPILGLAAVIMFGWRLVLGRADALIGYVVCASIVAQPHISMLGPVGALTATVILVAVVRRRLRTGSWFPPPWSRRGVLALVAGLLLWLPVIVEILAFFPGNLGQLVGLWTGGGGTANTGPSLGWGDVLGQVGGAIVPWGGRTVHIAAAVLTVGVATCCCGWLALRLRRGATSDHHEIVVSVGVFVSLVATVATIWTTSRIGNQLQLAYSDALWAAPVCLAAFTGWWLVLLIGRVWHPFGTPAMEADPRRTLVVSSAALLTVVLLLLAVPASSLTTSFGEQPAQPVLAAQTLRVVRAELDGSSGPVTVDYRGLYSWTSLGPAVIAGLEADGHSVYFDVFWPKPQDDDNRRLAHAPGDAARVLLRDAAGSDALATWPGDSGCVWHSLTPPPDAAPGTRIQVCVLR